MGRNKSEILRMHVGGFFPVFIGGHPSRCEAELARVPHPHRLQKVGWSTRPKSRQQISTCFSSAKSEICSPLLENQRPGCGLVGLSHRWIDLHGLPFRRVRIAWRQFWAVHLEPGGGSKGPLHGGTPKKRLSTKRQKMTHGSRG